MNGARALISWLPPEKGGRKSPPTGPVYATVVRFEEDSGWPVATWSLVLSHPRRMAHGRYWEANVAFLADKAPVELLKHNSRFELYEGRKLVAIGIIVKKTTAALPATARRARRLLPA